MAQDVLDHLPCPSEPLAMCTQRAPDAGSATGDVMSMDNASGPAEDASGVPFERSPRREP